MIEIDGQVTLLTLAWALAQAGLEFTSVPTEHGVNRLKVVRGPAADEGDLLARRALDRVVPAWLAKKEAGNHG